MKIKELFDIMQGHQITNEEIYLHQGYIPIYTAGNEIKGYWDKSIIPKEKLPCLTYPTKANRGEVFIQNKEFDANNTAVLIPKTKYKKKIDLEWFIYKLRPEFLKVQTSKSGVSYLNKEIVMNLEIFLPKLSIQKEEKKYLLKLETLKKNIINILSKIKFIENKNLLIEYSDYQVKGVSVNNIFDIVSGNSGLTEEYIYSQLSGYNKDDEKYLLLTGSVKSIEKNILIGKFNSPKKTTRIRVHKGEGIHIIRKGKAGVINFLSKGNYTLNDDAYILISKKNIDYKIDLEWLYYTQKDIFYKYSTSSDNGTWSKTAFLNHEKINVPSIKEQRKIKKLFKNLNDKKNKFNIILDEINKTFSKDIA